MTEKIFNSLNIPAYWHNLITLLVGIIAACAIASFMKRAMQIASTTVELPSPPTLSVTLKKD